MAFRTEHASASAATVAVGLLLALVVAACDGSGEPAPSSPSAGPSGPAASGTAPGGPGAAPGGTAAVPGGSAGPSARASATADPLGDRIRTAFRTAGKAHPGADLDRCTRRTPLTDKKCGTALAAAEQVAEMTALLLRAEDPKNADLLYGPLFSVISEFQGSYRQLRDPIPCYGLSRKPQPPAELRAEAQSICAEAAAIMQVRWRLLLNMIET
jgi:hypothetical protein